MECTQRLELTQDLNTSISEWKRPEQLGFLGICGTQYAIIKGPNKIGRDPQTCSIVLNLNSISRQHAVINVLNHNQYMLMDLGSANKTKLDGKTIQPYISYSLNNGSTVQFGDIFGVFRQLNDNDDLPMTQAIDIPETPVIIKHISKLTNVPCTTVPESPDISYKEESFIGASHTKRDDQFKSPKNCFIKTSGKTIAIQPIGSNKIDNVYWNSAKMSTSLNLSLDKFGSFDESKNTDLKETVIETKKNIYEMETQVPYINDDLESMYTANTQIATDNLDLLSINSLPTQISVPITDNLPEVCKINVQFNMKCDLLTEDKENKNTKINIKTKSIDNAETQNIFDAETQNIFQAETQNVFNVDTEPCSNVKSKFQGRGDLLNKNSKNISSDEEILFDEVETQHALEDFDSQPILPLEIISTYQNTSELNDHFNNDKDESIATIPKRRNNRIKSDSSTDCEDFDIQLTQKIPVNLFNEEDLTDCEDNIENSVKIYKKTEPKNDYQLSPTQLLPKENLDHALTNCEDVLDGKESYKKKSTILNKENTNIDFENMPTQVLDDMITNNIVGKGKKKEDMPTQVLDDTKFEDMLTQIIPQASQTKRSENEVQLSNKIISPFKIPVQSPIKIKRQHIPQITLSKNKSMNIAKIIKNEDDKYYESTQKIFDDLCSQKQNEILENNDSNDDVIHVPCSVGELEIGDQFRNISENLSSNQNIIDGKTSADTICSESDEKVNKYVDSLSTKQIRDIIVGETLVKSTQKNNNNRSDVEETPKKVKPLKLMDTDLPSSQEIKANVKSFLNSMTTCSSESEPENNSEECTPILFRNKKRLKMKIREVNTNKVEELPTRVITRQRKPTTRLLGSTTPNLLKSKILFGSDNEVDSEIIEENLTRMRYKIKSNNNNKEDNKSINKSITKIDQSKKRSNNKIISKEMKIETNNREEKPLDKKDSRDKIHLNMLKSKSNLVAEENVLVEKVMDKVSNEPEHIINKKDNIKSSLKSNRNIKSEGKKQRNKKEVLSEIKRNSVNMNKSPEEISEVRRSKRQQTAKEKVNKEFEKPKSILKPSKSFNQDQSTIYNISSSSTDSAKSLKRPIRDCAARADGSTSKRARKDFTSMSCSLRATPARTNKNPRVLFTAFPEPLIKEVTTNLNNLGATVVSDVLSCTVLVTESIKRTFKLLCAVSLGKPIVGSCWVQACHDTKMIVDPWLYLLKDETAEKRFKFNLHRTLVGKRNYLKGYHVSSTPNVKPGAAELKLIVECSGGTWGEGPSGSWVCVSCAADGVAGRAARRRGARVVSSEFVLSGVLQQRVEIHSYLINV